MTSSLAEKLARLARPRGRYLRPDPARPLEIGAFGRVAGGVLHKVGRIDRWMESVGIRGFELVRQEAHITRGSTLPSLPSQLGDQRGDREGQRYFHVPGLRFECIRDSWKLGEILVERAKRERHDPQFWDEEYCVVTGVCFYEVPSMREAESEGTQRERERAAPTADLEEPSEPWEQLELLSRSVPARRESHEGRAPSDGKCIAFFELHKVHSDEVGNRFWKSIRELST